MKCVLLVFSCHFGMCFVVFHRMEEHPHGTLRHVLSLVRLSVSCWFWSKSRLWRTCSKAWAKPTGLQVHRPTSLQGCRPPGLRVFRPSGLQASRPTGQQVYRPTSLQACRPPGLQAFWPSGLQASRPTGLRHASIPGLPLDGQRAAKKTTHTAARACRCPCQWPSPYSCHCAGTGYCPGPCPGFCPCHHPGLICFVIAFLGWPVGQRWAFHRGKHANITIRTSRVSL